MSEHLDRALAEMERARIDLLVLGREGNSRYVSGADRLALAGTRAFAPGCVVVRETGAVHLLSVTDDGVPAEFPTERLYPLSWNPVNLVGAVAAAARGVTVRRVGVDGLTPLFEELLAGAFPDAELVDGETLMRRVRRVKSPDDVAAIRAAVDVLDHALETVLLTLRPGVHERELLGTFEEARCAQGASVPAFQAAFCVVDDGAVRRFVTDRAVAEGDLVAVRAGVLVDGWEASLARTLPCGDGWRGRQGEFERWHDAWPALVDACRAGARVGAVRAKRSVTLHGVGLGYEGLADDDVLEPGMVVEVELTRDGIVGADMLLVTHGAPEVLTPYP